MKKLTVSAKVLAVKPVTNSDGSPVYRNNRVITHRIILAPSVSFEKAIAIALATKRNPESDTTTRPVTFCLKRDDGKYAIDLDANQMGLLTGGRMSPEQFQFVAPNCTFNGAVEIRELGDKIILRDGTEITIGESHPTKNGNPSNAHAAFTDFSSTLAPVIEQQIVHAMFAPKPTFHPVAQPQAPVIGELTNDELDVAPTPATKAEATPMETEDELEVGNTTEKK